MWLNTEFFFPTKKTGAPKNQWVPRISIFKYRHPKATQKVAAFLAMYHSHEAYETPELNSLEFSSDRLLKSQKIRW